jgi:hypothetical protein
MIHSDMDNVRRLVNFCKSGIPDLNMGDPVETVLAMAEDLEDSESYQDELLTDLTELGRSIPSEELLTPVIERLRELKSEKEQVLLDGIQNVIDVLEDLETQLTTNAQAAAEIVNKY